MPCVSKSRPATISARSGFTPSICCLPNEKVDDLFAPLIKYSAMSSPSPPAKTGTSGICLRCFALWIMKIISCILPSAKAGINTLPPPIKTFAIDETSLSTSESYVTPAGREYEPRVALDGGDDGLDFYRRLSREISRYIAKGGMLILEVGEGQAAEVLNMFEKRDYAMVVKDYQGVDRILKIAF